MSEAEELQNKKDRQQQVIFKAFYEKLLKDKFVLEINEKINEYSYEENDMTRIIKEHLIKKREKYITEKCAEMLDFINIMF